MLHVDLTDFEPGIGLNQSTGPLTALNEVLRSPHNRCAFRCKYLTPFVFLPFENSVFILQLFRIACMDTCILIPQRNRDPTEDPNFMSAVAELRTECD